MHSAVTMRPMTSIDASAAPNLPYAAGMSGRTRALIAVVVVTLGAACASGDDDDNAERSAPRGSATTTAETDKAEEAAAAEPADRTQYVLLDHPDWRLKEALDYRAGLGPLGKMDPDLDWYAEYDGRRIDHGGGSFTVPAVNVSGHTAGLDERREQLGALGFDGRPAEIRGRRALFAPAARGNPSLIVIELGPGYSVTLLSYDEVVDVRDVAALLVPVDEQAWVAAGGQMIHCAPFEPGCEPPAD